MRTRTSPRNQEILWRALGGWSQDPLSPRKPFTAEEISGMWWLSKRTRNMMLRDIEREAHKAAVKRALAKGD